MKWKHLPIIAFDTETTGLSAAMGDRVIEVGIVTLHLDEHANIVHREDFGALINPQISIPPEVQKLTGINDDDVRDAPLFEAVASDVHRLLASGILVAHNLPFDLGFLTKELQLCNLDWPHPPAELDTVDISRKYFPNEKSHKLEIVAQRLGVSLVNAHRATDDAAACGEVLAALLRRQPPPDDLQELLTWADGIGHPPANGPFGSDDRGRLIFTEGPHTGELVATRPLHLAWMEKARTRGPSGWTFKYPSSVRDWASRWLRIRGTGRARQHPKSFGQNDWVLDSSIAARRRGAGL